MGPKKDRRVMKIEVPPHTPTEFALLDTAADIQSGREMEQRESQEEPQKQTEERLREEGRRESTTNSADEGVADRKDRQN